jgi:hypothetical protein
VYVDKSWGNGQSVGVHNAFRRHGTKVAHGGNELTPNGKIAQKRRIARPINNPAITDQQIKVLRRRRYRPNQQY